MDSGFDTLESLLVLDNDDIKEFKDMLKDAKVKLSQRGLIIIYIYNILIYVVLIYLCYIYIDMYI